MTDRVQIRKSSEALVSVIIPHYLGEVLSRCLRSIFLHSSAVSFEVIVVDDQPRDDGSISRAIAAFPEIRIAKTRGAQGFGAACNAGLRAARGRYAAILNNDVEVAPGWLDELVHAVEQDSRCGIVQAKIRSLSDRTRFDYSGAAGGLIDWLGFPFALGRVFNEIEVDRGQYDEPRDIFWAVGSAFLVRRSCLRRTGLFDERFYMHMEEMDLSWRMHLIGFSVCSCPSAVVYHHNGFTLKQGSFKKAYLNHRNNLVLLLKNLPASRLLTVLPLRIALELATIVYGLLRRDWKHPVAAIAGMFWVLLHFGEVIRRRHAARAVRIVTDAGVLQQMHPTSIVLDHFLRGMDGARIAASAWSARASKPRPASRRPALSLSATSRQMEVTLANR